MNSNILTLVTKYKEKYEKDLEKLYPIINFQLSYTTVMNPQSYIGLHHPITILELDEEDMKYLFDKYSKKLEEEMNEKIEKIKQDYKIITT